MTPENWSLAINVAFVVLATPVASALTAVVVKIFALMKLKLTEQDRANMEAEFLAAINVGKTVATKLTNAHGQNDPKALQVVLDAATIYFNQHWPDRVKQIEQAVAASPSSVANLALPGPEGNNMSPLKAAISGRLQNINNETVAVVPVPAAPGPGGVARALSMLTAITLAGGLLLGACTPAQQGRLADAAATPPGQLFCALKVVGGPDLIVRLVAAGSLSWGAGAESATIALIAANATEAQVNAACAAAAVVKGAVAGVPVSPPAVAVPAVAVAAPAGMPTARVR